jgi:hypothetical protein
MTMSEPRHDGWQVKGLSAALLLVMSLAGWVWTANTTAIQDNKEKQEATARMLQRVAERIAVQEEAVRNQRETLQRIENGVDELRRTHGASPMKTHRWNTWGLLLIALALQISSLHSWHEGVSPNLSAAAWRRSAPCSRRWCRTEPMTPDLFLRLAVEPALSLLPESLRSTEAKAFLVAIALQESRLTARRQIGGPAHGYHQFELGGVEASGITKPQRKPPARSARCSTSRRRRSGCGPRSSSMTSSIACSRGCS